jgi:hypothetical protein
MGWATIKNGELLTVASQHFDVFITVDRNLTFQQNLVSFSISVIVISVIVLEARTNRLADLRPLIPQLLEAIDTVMPGTARFIGSH